MYLDKRFLKKFPKNKEIFITNKLSYFEKNLLNNYIYRDMPKGFWIMKIEGSENYKFRINNGDRIIFTYKYINGKNEVVLLKYVNHDEQILIGKKFNSVKYTNKSFEINKDNYIEDLIDEEECYTDFPVDSYLINFKELKQDILEDEYIALSVEENNMNDMHYLSKEQLESIEVFARPVIISGSAGSGKSMVGVRKLLNNEINNISSLYICKSEKLLRKFEEYYNIYSNSKNRMVTFITLKEYFLVLSGENKDNVLMFKHFQEWYKSLNENVIIKKFSCEEIWMEINSVIKSNYTKNYFLTLKEYCFSQKSHVENRFRNKVYTIFINYQKWLNSKCKIDENDLAYKVWGNIEKNNSNYDYCFIDEIQDMTHMEISSLLSRFNNKKNIMIACDENQLTNYNYFNLNELENVVENICRCTPKIILLNKNFRNSKNIHKLCKEIIELKSKYFNYMEFDSRCKNVATRDGNLPTIIYNSNNFIDIFRKVDDDVDSAIIIENKSVYDQLKNKKLPLGRVFTIDEIKGLEYKTIVCYDLTNSDKEEWNELFIEKRKPKQLIKYKINCLYVAASRAIENLYFLEYNSSILHEKFKTQVQVNNYIEIEDITKNKNNGHKENEMLRWLEEGKKLESIGNYYQAAHAYRKAKAFDACMKCEKKISIEDAKFNNLLYDTAMRIQSDQYELTYEIIKSGLEKFSEKYQVEFDYYAEIWTFVKDKQASARLEKYQKKTNEIMLEELAQCAFQLLYNDKNINTKKVSFHTTLIKDNRRIKLSELEARKDTVIIDINDKIEISFKGVFV